MNLTNLISQSISLHYLETENCWQRARQAKSQTDGTAVDVDSLGFLSSLLETFMTFNCILHWHRAAQRTSILKFKIKYTGNVSVI